MLILVCDILLAENTYPVRGVVQLNSTTVQLLTQGRLFVNILSPSYPNGLLRGMALRSLSADKQLLS